jgi:transcriptional regulator with XRE-family HTH domain
MENKTPIPKRLREARSRAELSQKTLGIRAGIDQFSASARINHYERGRHLPDYTLVERLAAILDVPVPYFYTADDELAALILRWGRMGKKDRQAMLEHAKDLAS